jgi:hypothetical protein
MTAVRRILVVVLNHEVREEDAEAIPAGIRMIKRRRVRVNTMAEPDAQVARERVNAEWRHRIVGLLDDEDARAPATVRIGWSRKRLLVPGAAVTLDERNCGGWSVRAGVI